MRKLLNLFTAIAFSFFSIFTLNAAEKWDMPMAYAASNFHSEMGVKFAEAVKGYKYCSPPLSILERTYLERFWNWFAC